MSFDDLDLTPNQKRQKQQDVEARAKLKGEAGRENQSTPQEADSRGKDIQEDFKDSTRAPDIYTKTRTGEKPDLDAYDKRRE